MARWPHDLVGKSVNTFAKLDKLVVQVASVPQTLFIEFMRAPSDIATSAALNEDDDCALSVHKRESFSYRNHDWVSSLRQTIVIVASCHHSTQTTKSFPSHRSAPGQ